MVIKAGSLYGHNDRWISSLYDAFVTERIIPQPAISESIDGWYLGDVTNIKPHRVMMVSIVSDDKLA